MYVVQNYQKNNVLVKGLLLKIIKNENFLPINNKISTINFCIFSICIRNNKFGFCKWFLKNHRKMCIMPKFFSKILHSR